ncbi:MAG: hypothetical protein VB031_05515 [Eubacteriaceae bacterium]|nr:hypothetical protein [Eubacteriaceae bacterium]
MVELKKMIRNLIIIAVIMPLLMIGVVVWKYGTEYLFNVAAVYIVMIGTVLGASLKIKNALEELESGNDKDLEGRMS